MEQKSIKKSEKMASKKPEKKQACKIWLFQPQLAVSDAKVWNLNTFWDDFGCPRACFCGGFLGFRLGLDFKEFSVKNVKKAKTEKVAFVL